ncbi:helix-turn-helix domain-containing protein [Candidatus Dojkabacteria bacterium]|nr:helix-turn-helix domain-containing protein [Candidatus Dojkabacteria bacterium]
MKIKWVYEKSNDIYRLNYTFSRIFGGFYINRGIPLMPLNVNTEEKKVVKLPDCEFGELVKYRDRFALLSNDKYKIFTKIDKEIYDIFSAISNDGLGFESVYLIEKRFNEIQVEFEKFCTQFFANINLDDIEITVYPTHFGTQSSYDILLPNETNFNIFFRNDSSLEDLVSVILSALFYYNLQENYLASWMESQTLIYWLLQETSLTKVLGLDKSKLKESMVYKIKNGYSKQVRDISDKVNSQLCLNLKQIRLELIQDKIYKDGKEVIGLVEWEKNVLKYFLNNQDRIIEYNQISDILNIQDEDYSLWAIAKRIQRLRDKMDMLGLGGYVIQNVRGKGFMLNNR